MVAEDSVIKLTADFFKILAHPARIKILHSLKNGERCVCDLLEEIDIEQSNLSQHLGMMKQQGIIDSRKDGQKVSYHIVYQSVMNVVYGAEKTLSEQISHRQNILDLNNSFLLNKNESEGKNIVGFLKNNQCNVVNTCKE